MSNDNNPTTIKTWLDWAKTSVDPADAELIALHVFAEPGTDRSWLASHQDDALPIPFDNPYNPANEMVKLRHEGTPMAYLLGRKEFYGRPFQLTPDVLIPRPESEAIIDLAKTLDLPTAPIILDIGTGSGCLAITLALEFPQAQVTAVDISPAALNIAAHNNLRLEGRVQFIESDLLNALEPLDGQSYDLLVANLPYVNPAWDWLDQHALSYEPSEALFVEAENGLALYHRLFDELADFTTTSPVRHLILEADPSQHEQLIALAKDYGWEHATTSGYALAFQPTPTI